ncbi:MAG: GSCFA domain-containing protein [Deltaproteobacteria bacterium]|jgi:hypothetical protein|nr:GSCFA domain-containing protein [Deltaproteobacteria bacterium]
MPSYFSNVNPQESHDGALPLIDQIMVAQAQEPLSSYDNLEQAEERLSLSGLTEDQAKRRQLLEEAAELIKEEFFSSSLIGAKKVDTGLKLSALYQTLAIEYKQAYARTGLEITAELRHTTLTKKQRDIIDLYDSNFHLLTNNIDLSEQKTKYLLDKYHEAKLNIPYYSFNKHIEISTFFSNILSDINDTNDLLNNKNSTLKKGSETPYSLLSSDTHFWKTAVAQRMPTQLGDIYHKKFSLDKSTKIMCAGSCFAQHIGNTLRENGFNFLNYEPTFTEHVLLAKIADQSFGYNMYSARYGNIYTTRQLRQLFLRSFDRFQPVEEFWLQNDRYYDPFRPSIEPYGYYTLQEARLMRKSHLAAVKRLFLETEVLVFTLGLTECWTHQEDGAVYPVCPGAAAGVFDPDKYKFLNLTYNDIITDLNLLVGELKEVNPKIKLLLTVSPVPLVATASDNHVLVATMKSKAILRAAAAEIYDQYDFVDYFPSYDLISSIPFGRGAFCENLRQVKPEVVKFVMTRFLQAHGFSYQTEPTPSPKLASVVSAASTQQIEEKCEELLLEAFNK